MLIAACVYSTDQYNRLATTRRWFETMRDTVDWSRHRLIVSDNGSHQPMFDLYKEFQEQLLFKVLDNGSNLGTANAINRAWREREPGEHAVKCDHDWIVHQAGWADYFEDVFYRDPEIGIIGLKRRDLDERPWGEGWKQSTLRMLPQEKGQRWLAVEEVNHVMGTCQGYSNALLEKIGYLYQGNWPYGFDDSLAAARAAIAGFKSAFIVGFDIEHIDMGGDEYTDWKHKVAGDAMRWFNHTRKQYQSGKKDPYYDGGFSK